jgi:LCP family protein required for cell wall assembly
VNPFLKTARKYWWRWLLFGFSFGGMALMSVTLGTLLALSSATSPLLMKRPLTSGEAATFTQESLTDRPLLFPKLSQPVNILVMGMSVLTSDVTDSAQSAEDVGYLAQVNSFEGLSDVLLLLRFDPQTNQLTMLSIPRDTRIITNGRTLKINAANKLGGPAESAQLVSQLLFDIPIDRYVRVNVNGIEQLIDALGGVTVTIPQNLKYTDESQHLYIDLKAGKQHLDGEETLQLLRFRNDGQGDIGRIGRQQQVMQALIKQKLNPLTLLRLPQILFVIFSNVDSNLQGDELVALGRFLLNLDRPDVDSLTLPGEANLGGYRGVSYWLPDEDSIRDLVRQNFSRESEGR